MQGLNQVLLCHIEDKIGLFSFPLVLIQLCYIKLLYVQKYPGLGVLPRPFNNPTNIGSSSFDDQKMSLNLSVYF